MKFMGPLIIVKNMDETKKFYKEILDSKIIMDFGENVTFSGGFSAQTEKTWLNFIAKNKQDITYNHHCGELYFEEYDFDAFIEKINKLPNIKLVRGIVEHEWGQRSIRFYDPDEHMIEVGEPMDKVCKRFLSQGLSVEETSKKSLMPISFVKRCSLKK